jgi:hypothetical protein
MAERKKNKENENDSENENDFGHESGPSLALVAAAWAEGA